LLNCLDFRPQKVLATGAAEAAASAAGDKNYMKWVSLATLTLQNAIMGLSMRYARSRPGDMFFSATAVFMTEIVKMLTCMFLVFRGEEGQGSPRKFLSALHKYVWANKMDTLKVCIPSAIFLAQVNTSREMACSIPIVFICRITYSIYRPAIWTWPPTRSPTS